MGSTLKALMQDFVDLKDRLAELVADREVDIEQARLEIKEKKMLMDEDIAEKKKAQRIQKQIAKLLGE